MKRSAFFVGFAVALCTAASSGAQTLAVWDQPVNVAAIDGTLTKNGGCDSCPDAGAHSAKRIDGAGYAEFVPAAGKHLLVGLSGAASPAINGADTDFGVRLWPSGVFEIRERGIYRSEGSFVDGDHFRIANENGAIVYRRNGVLVYTSKTLPSSSLTLAATMISSGSSFHDAVLYAGSDVVATPPPPPPPISTLDLPPGIVSKGPYQAIVERLPHAEPVLPVLGPAGTWITDPVFQSPILRVTDNMTRPGLMDRSYRSPSSPHQAAWSANASYFYVVSGDGTVIPYAFNARARTASRIQPTTTGSGGMILSFASEPQFSVVDDAIIYGVVPTAIRSITQYDFSTRTYSSVLDLNTVVPGLTGYIGGITSSDGPTERLLAFFGGPMQDKHHYVAVFNKKAPQNLQLLDTTASTLNGVPTPVFLGFSLHHVAMDRSGRYVMLYTTYADQGSARKAAQSYLWDTQTGAFSELGVNTRPYGHDAFGYGVSVNQDCCTSTSWDPAQWQFRTLSSPVTPVDLIKTVLSPKSGPLVDHTTWNNARPDRLMPVISGLYRGPMSTTQWRAWDDEIVAIQTDAGNVDPTIWRFAHHRSNVSSDADPNAYSFWYEPRPNISQDGRWVLFTSNWEKTLGTDPGGDAATHARQDVFIVELRGSVPPAPNVTIAAATLPLGRATVSYAATLQAAGGRGTFAWSLTQGALPAGLSLDTSTGAIAGVPQAIGTSTFTVKALDPTEPLNTASATFAITIAPSPVTMSVPALGTARLTTAYSATPQASGGLGNYAWSNSAGSLPTGLTVDPITGTIAGTPLTVGTYAFTLHVAAAEESANSADATATLVVGPSPIAVTTSTIPAGRERVSYRASLLSAGGTGTATWSVASGSLPGGLTLTASTGVISGTPTLPGTYNVMATATDAGDSTNTATVPLTFTITAAVKVASPRTIPQATVGVFYSYEVLAANVQGKAKWNVQGGSLPPGMSLSSTGVLSGTCVVPGNYSFNARVKDANTDDTLTLTLTVK